MLQLKESGKASEKISKTEIRTQPDKEFKELATKMLKLGRIMNTLKIFIKFRKCKQEPGGCNELGDCD